MRVLVVGAGGREHALCHAIARSPRLEKLFAAPGNAGMSEIAECVDISADDVESLARFAALERIDLTVVGPEDPLVAGITDEFKARGLRVFGPNRAVSRLEGSKTFTKEMCRKHHIPTAASRTFDDVADARAYVADLALFPAVVKADGLAAGKGVVIAKDREQALAAIEAAMVDKVFGDAGKRVVVEEFLGGTEVSVLAIVDGKTFAVLETARDHKAAYDYDKGPNTGGMGTVSPSSSIDAETLRQVESTILLPTIHAMKREAKGYRGFLFAGLMLTAGGPKLLEINVRFGDPEAQAIFARLKTDLLEVLDAATDGRLDEIGPLEWDTRSSCCVVLASGGYPGPYETGQPIDGLKEAGALDDVTVYHAGTALREGRVVTSGGRVLGVTALGDTLDAARHRAYDAVEKIRFQDAYYRTDIGRTEIEAKR